MLTPLPPRSTSRPPLRTGGSPYTPSRPTSTAASPGSVSPGERQKPTGTWEARTGARGDASSEEEDDNNASRNGNQEHTNDSEPNESYIMPSQPNVNEPEIITPLTNKISTNTLDSYDTHSGRLVDYSGSSNSIQHKGEGMHKGSMC